MATTIDGLVTGLDTTKLIEGLLSVQQRRIELLAGQQDKVVQQQSAFKNIEAKLLALQTEVARLGRTQNGVFDKKKVTSSREDLVAAAASASATPGVYALRVNSLARSHQLASQGFDDPDSTITQGTLQIRVGTGATTTLTIDSTNNTVQGLASAINNSGAGVTATIINDGSDSRSQPYRLVLTSSKTGAASAITITNNLGADSGGARRPELTTTYVGAAVTGASYTGTSTPTSNTGAGAYTGTANKTYNFTVTVGGTVGTTNGIQVSFVDSTGSNSGTVTLNAGDADAFKTVAEGLQVKFNVGTLATGETFSIDAFAPTVQQAADASVTLGSGSGALTVQSDANQVDDVIAGVTLDLLAADSTKDVQVAVANDTETARDAVLDFVAAYNELMEFIDDQVRYDSETGVAGVLLGNRSATTIQDELRRVVGELVGGVNGQMNRLGALGITTNSQGRLDVNQAKLDDALAGRVTGVSFSDVRRLFALAGESTSGGVQFVTGGVRTKASATPYQVDVSQAAERAAVTATNALGAATGLTSSNNTLTLTIDGKTSSTITLATGTYTRLGLAQELEAQINVNKDLPGRRVTVGLDAVGDRLVITSDTYGLASEVKIETGTALSVLGFTGTENDKGQDVVGKFVVNGVDEPAIGTGQFLVGNAANANTADLQIRVALGTSQISDGAEASLTVTRGVASKLDVILSSFLDPVTGRMKTIDDAFETHADDIQEAIDRQTEILESRRQSLLRQFVALERAVSQLRATGDFLTAQLTSLTSQRRTRS